MSVPVPDSHYYLHNKVLSIRKPQYIVVVVVPTLHVVVILHIVVWKTGNILYIVAIPHVVVVVFPILYIDIPQYIVVGRQDVHHIVCSAFFDPQK